MIDRTDRTLSLSTQAGLLNISRASLYYRRRGPSAKEVRLKHRIDELYTQYPFYGSRRIHRQLQREGEVVGENTVAKYMRQMGIRAIYPGPNLSKRAKNATIYPYLLRQVTAGYPNHVWGIDITYIRLQRGWLYLVAVLDWYSRFIIGWELDDTLEIPFVLRTVDRALAQATPTIWNSDQGSHFTSPQYLDRLTAAGVQISMDGKGRAIDNIFTERLWRTLKYEEVYLKDYETPRQARRSLTDYIQFYNYQRLHQSLDYLTPAELYFNSHLLTIIPAKGEKTSLTITDSLS
jgi:putative transposase